MIKAIEIEFIKDTNELDKFGNEIVSRETTKVGATLTSMAYDVENNNGADIYNYTMRVALNNHDITSKIIIYNGYYYDLIDVQEQEIISYCRFDSNGKVEDVQET